MPQPLDDLMAISRNIRARAKVLEAAYGPRTALVLAIEGELEIAEHEAAESIADRDRYEAGYHQGWADAIRVILGAIGPDGTGT
jgi:regulator of extracellular matrix RemA (YlzA/DUF370 family)